MDARAHAVKHHVVGVAALDADAVGPPEVGVCVEHLRCARAAAVLCVERLLEASCPPASSEGAAALLDPFQEHRPRRPHEGSAVVGQHAGLRFQPEAVVEQAVSGHRGWCITVGITRRVGRWRHGSTRQQQWDGELAAAGQVVFDGRPEAFRTAIRLAPRVEESHAGFDVRSSRFRQERFEANFHRQDVQ